MPTSRRNWCMSTFGSSTRMPHTSIVPRSMVSRRSIQRSAVLFPEPLAPITAIISPLATSSDTPLSTWFEPKLLYTSPSLTIADIELFLHRLAPARERITQHEIEDPDQSEHEERLKNRVVDDLARASQFDETNHRSKRRHLDDLHQETHRWRQRKTQRLRNDHEAQGLPARQRQAFGGFPLGLGHGVYATPPDVA